MLLTRRGWDGRGSYPGLGQPSSNWKEITSTLKGHPADSEPWVLLSGSSHPRREGGSCPVGTLVCRGKQTYP